MIWPPGKTKKKKDGTSIKGLEEEDEVVQEDGPDWTELASIIDICVCKRPGHGTGGGVRPQVLAMGSVIVGL